MSEITIEVQELIDYVLEIENDISFKVCTQCKRNLPAHLLFFTKHDKCKYGVTSSCKECNNDDFSFGDILHPWYETKELFISNFRKMSIEQLVKYYNKPNSTISYFAKSLNLNKFEIVKTLTEDEILFMYQSVLKNEIKVFTNGIYNYDQYIIYLIRYMINNILNWNRLDVCNYYNLQTFKDNGLGGLLGIKHFNSYDYLIKTFPEYDIKIWELKSSSVGNWTEDSIKQSLEWLKTKLFEDKNINNIHDASVFGFRNLIEQYNLAGLCATQFSGSYVKFFEFAYQMEFNKKEKLKLNYTFNVDNSEINRTKEGVLYKITDLYNLLDERGKTLINEIVKFCEVENRFPSEKDLSNKKGYICRTQFYKYFSEKSLKSVFKYIIPIYDLSDEIKVENFKSICDAQNYNAIIIKPKRVQCIKCGQIKNFDADNFTIGCNNKFGLKYECKECENKESIKKYYRDKSIYFNDVMDISPIQWWEHMFSNKLRSMPEFCYSEKNLILIVRHIINNIVNIFLKEDICNVVNFGRKQMGKYRIETICNRLGGKLQMLQKCFPELNIIEDDVYPETYSDEETNLIIKNWITTNSLTIDNLLRKGCTYSFDKRMTAMMAARFHKQNQSTIDMIMWYCKRNNILHSIFNRDLIIWDFEEMPPKFWINKNNRILRIKYYCETECEEKINSVLNNTNLFRFWIFKYFRQEQIAKIISYKYSGSLYNLLVEAYPEVINDKLLFEWEWHTYSKNDNESLIKMLREFVLYRMNDIIVDLQNDIPKYINGVYIRNLYPKFCKQIHKKRFDSYFQWVSLAFPEYADKWNIQMFGDTIAFDGVKCGSKQEMFLYEYFKKDLNLKFIKHIGNERTGKYTFELNEEYEYVRFCPDFVLEYIEIKDNKVKLTKPIYIEYYGMYNESHKSPIFQNYVIKTQIKNHFFKSNKDITFVDYYPNEINDTNIIKSKIIDAINMSN
jgi:hypothetical protein